MSTLPQDLRFALRLLAKTPGFTITAIAVLALGIGVNTAIFSLARDLLFSPRPFPRAADVLQLYTQDKKNPQRYRMFSYPTYRDVAEHNAVFTGVLAHNLTMVGVSEGELSRRTFAALVSSNYFSVLEVPLARGRAFRPEEETPGAAAPVAIASYVYWQKTGFDPALVGKTVRVNERPFTIVGIAPAHFTGTMMLFGPELYFPLSDFDLLQSDFDAAAKRTLEHRDAYRLFVVGRLKPGVTPAAAAAALQSMAAGFETTFPGEQRDQTFIARPLPRLSTSDSPADEKDIGLLGPLLIGMAALVLLVACLNLANMLLARGAARRKEIAIRLALGGGRARIVRQLVTEGFVLALAGGVGGVVMALWVSALLGNAVAAQVPMAMFMRGPADPVVFVATLGFCALATVCFALGPALKLARTDPLADLKTNAGEDAIRRRRAWLPRNPLVVAQLALSLGLLTVAALFVRGAWKAGHVDTGFRADETLVAEVDAGLAGYDERRSLELYRAAAARLAALPGVEAASVGGVVPFGFVNVNRPVQRAGVVAAPDAKPATAAEGLAYTVRWNSVGADYFRAMGLPLLRGRAFTALETDAAGAPAVAIIDEVLARKLWPDGDALGQRIQFASRDAPKAALAGNANMGASETIAAKPRDPPAIEVVGIVPSTRWQLFEKRTGGQIFVPFAQGFQSNAFFHVRFAGRLPADLQPVVAAVRGALREAAPGVPVFSVKTFRQHLDSSLQLWTVRIGAIVFSVFGGLALVLAVVGVYGVKAYSVARRTREIGIRMALGADPRRVLVLVFGEGARMTLVGVALGLLLALGIGRVVAGLLYQVSPVDVWAFTLAPAALSLAALAACWLPARRATRVPPIVALRTE